LLAPQKRKCREKSKTKEEAHKEARTGYTKKGKRPSEQK
jgi:hypothetical protein